MATTTKTNPKASKSNPKTSKSKRAKPVEPIPQDGHSLATPRKDGEVCRPALRAIAALRKTKNKGLTLSEIIAMSKVSGAIYSRYMAVILETGFIARQKNEEGVYVYRLTKAGEKFELPKLPEPNHNGIK